MFIKRAIGKSPSGLSVRWSCEGHRFEDIPWNPPYKVIDALPRGTQRYFPERYDETFAPYLHIELQGSDAWETTRIQEWANLWRFG